MALPESQLPAIPSQSLNVAIWGGNQPCYGASVGQTMPQRTIRPVIIFIGDICKPFPEMGGL